MSLSEIVAAELRAEIGRAGVQMQDLAAQVDQSPTWLRDRVNGRRSLSLEDLTIICEALSIEPADVLTAALERQGAAPMGSRP